MRLRLTPRDNAFYELFTDTADNVVAGVGLLRELVAAPSEQRAALAERIRAVEHRGDDLVQAIMERLDTSFVTPFDREDIYRLALRLDDVLDFMEAAADLTVLYQVGDFPPGVGEQVSLLCQSAELTARAMPGLRDLQGLTQYWTSVNDVEDAADRVYRRLLAELFNGGHDTLTVLKLKEIVDNLESAADGFEHVADVVRSIAVKES
jgi:predicted phosphate transport protein (TIGR00153 family)